MYTRKTQTHKASHCLPAPNIDNRPKNIVMVQPTKTVNTAPNTQHTQIPRGAEQKQSWHQTQNDYTTTAKVKHTHQSQTPKHRNNDIPVKTVIVYIQKADT